MPESKIIQNKSFVVYLIGPSPDGRFYVGQTENFHRRMNTHEKADGGCPRFHDAIRMWGWGAFEVKIIGETYYQEEADSLEIRNIEKYNSLWPGGYNMTLGGRATRFEPNARVTGFIEPSVSSSEILDEAYFRLHAEVGGCPVCGFYCSECGVTREFGEHALKHLTSGKDLEAFEVSGTGKLAKKFRECKDANYYIDLMRATAGRSMKIADIVPIAAIQYVRQLIPFIQASLKRSILVEKGEPSLHLGRFIPFPGRKRDALQIMNVHRFLRKRKRELLGSGAERIRVYRDALARFGADYKKKPHIEGVLIDRGATRNEIEQAKLDAKLHYKAECMGKTELQSIRPEIGETLDDKKQDRIDFSIFAGSSGYLEYKDLRNRYVFADDALWSEDVDGPSLLFLFENEKVRFGFATHEGRREFVKNLLETPLEKRKSVIRQTIIYPDTGIEVKVIERPEPIE